MSWGIVELEPEVRDWLEQLPTERFATAAFYERARRALARCMGEEHDTEGDE